MLISTRSRYALRALVTMVRTDWSIPCSLADLAETEGISQRYLEQIFRKLRARRLVRGRRGPGGGYVIARNPADITLFEVIGALETGFLAPDCVDDAPGCSPSGNGRRRRAACPRRGTCRTRILWQKLRDSCQGFLEAHSLADLALGNVECEERHNVEVL